MTTKNTVSTSETLAQIDQFAFRSNNEVRVVPKKAFKVGKTIRQGDLYVTRLSDKTTPIDGCKVFPGETQLIPGNTKGSRHVAHGNIKVYFKTQNVSFTEGPMIIASEDFTITHPEHAHFKLPKGTYQVNYQTDLIRKNRVKD